MTTQPTSMYMIEARPHVIPGDGAAALRMVAPTSSSGPDETVEEAAARANSLHEACQASLRKGFAYAVEAGRALSAIRARLPHGRWVPFVQGNLVFSLRTAQVYMRMAAFADEQAQHAAPDVGGVADDDPWQSIRAAAKARKSAKAGPSADDSGRRRASLLCRWDRDQGRLVETVRELDEAALQDASPAQRRELRRQAEVLMAELFKLLRRTGRPVA